MKKILLRFLAHLTIAVYAQTTKDKVLEMCNWEAIKRCDRETLKPIIIGF